MGLHSSLGTGGSASAGVAAISPTRASSTERIQLVVEVDGAVHARKELADARRDRKLSFRVVRVSAALVLRNVPAAVALVRSAV